MICERPLFLGKGMGRGGGQLGELGQVVWAAEGQGARPCGALEAALAMGQLILRALGGRV